ncbi:MAG TPA: extracellular solute-binding protein [Bacillota bacterium]|nr:extracellular solute-binding protein [Bacillota bacterium]
MFKSRMTILMAVLLVVVLFVGIIAPSTAASKVKLVVWGRDLTDDDPAHAYIKALVNGFKAKNPDIDLEYVAQGDPGLMDKTKVVMAANKGLPDIFQSWGGSTMGGYADAGRLLDLTKDLKSIPGSAAARDAMTWKGKIYGVAPFFAIAGIFYNEGIFKANNLTVPTTVADMEKVADTLKAKGIQPFACGARDKWPPLAMYMYFVDRFGGISAFGNAQSRKGSFDAEAFVKAAQKYQEWIKKGYFGEKPLGEAYGDAQQLMATGKAAMHVTGSWMCAQYADPGFTDQSIGFAAFPEMAGGKGKISDMMGMTDIGFAATKVAASKKAAVVKFMKYAMSVEAASAEKGRICSVPGVKAPTRLTEMAAGVFGKAQAVQFWWDQDLPPALGGPLNDTIGMFFLPDTDVAKALADFEKKVVDGMGPVKK